MGDEVTGCGHSFTAYKGLVEMCLDDWLVTVLLSKLDFVVSF